jgi:hypothetical protein
VASQGILAGNHKIKEATVWTGMGRLLLEYIDYF